MIRYWRHAYFCVSVRVVANKTFSVAQGVKMIGAPSERWYIERLRDARLPGRKVGKIWRLTEEDIADALDILKNDSPIAKAPSGLTPRSRLRATDDRHDDRHEKVP